MKQIHRILLLPVLFIMTFLVMAAPASAADAWLPNNFDPGQRVYVDPALTNHRDFPVRVDGLEAQLDKRSSADGVEYYFVYTQVNPDALAAIPPQYGKEYASWQLDNLVVKWSANSSFNAKRAVVIYISRGVKNPNSFSYAANAGSELQAFGFTSSYFTSTLTSVRQQYLPNDVPGFAVAVADDVNGKYSSELSHRAFMKALPMYLLYLAIALVLIGIGIWRALVYRKWANLLGPEVAEWGPKMDSVTQLYQQLRSPDKGYLDFITDQAGRRASFELETKELYEAKLGDFKNFSIRRELAARIYEAAKKAYEGRSFFNPGKLKVAYESLTSTTIVVTGKELELKEVTDVFGGLTEKQEFQPGELLANINALFTSVNTGFAKIMQAFEEAEADKALISRTLAEVNALEPAVKAAELDFTPFKERADGIATDAETQLANISKNPVGKLTASNRLEAGVLDLKGDIEKCIAIKGALPKTVQGIATVRERVATLRGEASRLTAYPVVDGEAAPGDDVAPKFLLTEEGHNPDSSLTSADQHVATCGRELLAGEWEKAQAAKEAAEAATKAATATIDGVLAARKYVETNVPVTRESHTRLTQAIPDAETAVGGLQSGFLASNYEGEPDKVRTATEVSDGTEAELAVVRGAYYGQNFVAARAKLESIEATIASAEAGLKQVHSRLAELKQLRTHAKDTAETAFEKSAALKDKRKQKSFTTSAATDTEHRQAATKVAELHMAVRENIADWPALAAQADGLVAQLARLDGQVDAQEAAHRDATAKVRLVEQAVAAAATECNHDDVLNAAKTELRNAQSELRVLQETLQTEKSDWAALAASATAKKGVADKAKTLAKGDKQLAGEARTEISEASALIQRTSGTSVSKSGRVGGSSKSFSERVDTSSASAKLRAANTALAEKQYQSAKDNAAAAKKAVAKAKEKADDACDAAIAAAVTAWNLANPPRSTSSGGGYSGGSRRSGGSDDGFSGGGFGGGGFSGGGSDSSSATGNSGGGTDNNFG